MTVTYSIDHTPTTTESVNVEVAEKSAFSFVRTTVDEKTGENSSIYVLSSGDATLPATVTFRTALSQNGKGPSRRISVTFSTFARSDDSVTGEVKTYPINATISVTIPQNVQVELADIGNLLGNLFSLLYPSVSAGVRSTAWLAKLLFGVSQVA